MGMIPAIALIPSEGDVLKAPKIQIAALLCILPWTSLCLSNNQCADEKSAFDRRKSLSISKYSWGIESDHQLKKDQEVEVEDSM